MVDNKGALNVETTEQEQITNMVEWKQVHKIEYTDNISLDNRGSTVLHIQQKLLKVGFIFELKPVFTIKLALH